MKPNRFFAHTEEVVAQLTKYFWRERLVALGVSTIDGLERNLHE